MIKTVRKLARRGVNLLQGRKIVVDETIDHQKAYQILEDAVANGITTFKTKARLGGDPIVDNESTAERIRTVLDDLAPHNRHIEGKWIYRTEFGGEHQVFRGANSEVHYLDARNVMFGGCYRYRSGDEGNKPHPNHSINIKYRILVKTE